MLPDLRNREEIFLDVETTSFDDKVPALNPWEGHRIAGIAICAEGDASYIPVRHQHGENVPLDEARDWLAEVLATCGTWVNHNVKFDAHFVAHEGIAIPTLVDTVVLAKMIDSDARTHALKPLCRDIGLPMDEEVELKAWLKGAKTKDYGAAPADIVGRYAKMDVIGNRALYRHLLEQLPSDMEELWEMEKKLTNLLYRMEVRGLHTDRDECRREQVRSLRAMVEASDRIQELTGVELKNSPKCLFEILCVQLGLPILARTDNGSPSFDKAALKLYEGLPEVRFDERASGVIDALGTYREEAQFKGLFADSFIEKGPHLHPSYNQLVRTGRMSSSGPNSQQLNKRAKKLIVPKGAFFSTDASQVEFRVIAHYIQDEDVIRAYTDNADTDFHTWVAELCGVDRKPAKTMNFAMAYGAGKQKITQQLSQMLEVETDDPREFERLTQMRANEIFARYHERLPGVKRTSEKANASCRRKGYIRNVYGRRRHLPLSQTHKAFNSLVQGCAMDITKTKMVELDEFGARIVANVHDEILIDDDPKIINDPEWQREVLAILEGPTKIRVPIRWDWGTSEESWADA